MKAFLTGLVAAVCLAVAPAFASPISAFSGNTQPYNSGTTDGATVNFAVYSTAGGTAGDTFGTGVSNFDSLFTGGSGSLDTSASYLYVYQTVANAPSGQNVFQNTVGVVAALSWVTSYGRFDGTMFSSTVLGTGAGFSNAPSPASTGASPVILSGQSGLTSPSMSIGSSSVKATYLSDLAYGTSSTLWGFTSNLPPHLGNTAVIEVGGANGTAPTTVPEPASLALLALAAPALALRRRKRHQSDH